MSRFLLFLIGDGCGPSGAKPLPALFRLLLREQDHVADVFVFRSSRGDEAQIKENMEPPDVGCYRCSTRKPRRSSGLRRAGGSSVPRLRETNYFKFVDVVPNNCLRRVTNWIVFWGAHSLKLFRLQLRKQNYITNAFLAGEHQAQAVSV